MRVVGVRVGGMVGGTILEETGIVYRVMENSVIENSVIDEGVMS